VQLTVLEVYFWVHTYAAVAEVAASLMAKVLLANPARRVHIENMTVWEDVVLVHWSICRGKFRWRSAGGRSWRISKGWRLFWICWIIRGVYVVLAKA
jgi:hypothetical protein